MSICCIIDMNIPITVHTCTTVYTVQSSVSIVNNKLQACNIGSKGTTRCINFIFLTK